MINKYIYSPFQFLSDTWLKCRVSSYVVLAPVDNHLTKLSDSLDFVLRKDVVWYLGRLVISWILHVTGAFDKAPKVVRPATDFCIIQSVRYILEIITDDAICIFCVLNGL